jgi:hypothetical protein
MRQLWGSEAPQQRRHNRAALVELRTFPAGVVTRGTATAKIGTAGGLSTGKRQQPHIGVGLVWPPLPQT